ncbi:serine-threonine protein kinase 19-domain-containing protein [Talaromyces proteolyticus]|uniref:Serine-threonine protein kinase 19-domain-containing protein n=1 Tax=Talaromyces proteolyticus TaxID=1131652 RepID=A0AAD4Q1A2_9EURO|nr:serine-threonine protein kinase 19-domain-containing protein [Talaromyces proteolyticus]KAH8698280.1 serine-threonine protein kinase 19-domain-containing protein [Talaromyces proteolyticus]
MPLRITSAPVSGIKKKKSSTPRSRASPFASHARTKPSARRDVQATDNCRSGTDEVDGGALSDSGPLADVGISRHVADTANLDDVLQAMRYIKDSMFEDLPARAGMNSTRIAEVLNLRRLLPPLVSVAHVHTVLQAPTQVEREIVSLLNSGHLRRLIVPGRGNDAAGLGDCLILADDLTILVQDSNDLDQNLKDRFIHVIGQLTNTTAMPAMTFSPAESMALVRAGFLVTASSLSKGSLNVASLPELSPAASGQSSDAIQASRASQSRAPTFFLSLPNTGPYLRLLNAGRSHLITLLKKSKYHEAPLTLLRDRWDGSVEIGQSFSVAKRLRGEFSGVLPGRTKKWKQFYGMNFRWILEHSLGAGLVELFDTGSVGPAVRCL